MPKINFIENEGLENIVDAPSDISLMEAALRNGIGGIKGDCGGACSCATCHVYIGHGWVNRVPPKLEMEDAMIEFVLDIRDTSRLSCQIRLTNDLDGIVVEIPTRQA